MVPPAPAVSAPVSRMPSPPAPGLSRGAASAWASLVVGLLALAWVPASLWPSAGLPAWPAVSLGLLAVLVSWGRGGALLRGIGGIAGFTAAVAGALQIGVLWAAAEGLSYM